MNWYKQAMKLFFDGGLNYEAICQHIAADHPKLFCQAVENTGEFKYIAECRALVAAGKKIDAIKIWRRETGLGLKEAKDAVEAL